MSVLTRLQVLRLEMISCILYPLTNKRCVLVVCLEKNLELQQIQQPIPRIALLVCENLGKIIHNAHLHSKSWKTLSTASFPMKSRGRNSVFPRDMYGNTSKGRNRLEAYSKTLLIASWETNISL